MKEDIEQQLRDWSLQMVKKYSWLSIRFEFSERKGVFLVSFSPESHTNNSDEFNRDALLFEDSMNDLYGDDAPLFEDEERLFKLSANATIIKAEKPKPTFAPIVSRQSHTSPI